MSSLLPVLLFFALGLALIAWGIWKRRRGARHGAGEALDAEAFAAAGREAGNPLIVVGAALLAITLIVWILGR